MGESLQTSAFAAFYAVLQMEARVMDAVTKDFETRAELPVSWFEVLAVLCTEEGGSRRMNELADALLISRGGATKLVTRMEEAGLVERSTPPDDRRATVATLTAAGTAAVEQAAPIHAELAECYFGQFLDREDMEALVRAATKVLSGLGAPLDLLQATLPDAAAEAGAEVAAGAQCPVGAPPTSGS